MLENCLTVGEYGVEWVIRDDCGANVRKGVLMAGTLSHFIGTHEHSLDAKGRITLPSRFRSNLGDACVISVSQYGDKCLVLWRMSDFDDYCAIQRAKDISDIDVRRPVKVWLADTFDQEIDASGRLAIPQRLRNMADLTREVVVIGALDTIELWSPSNWDEFRGVNAAS